MVPLRRPRLRPRRRPHLSDRPAQPGFLALSARRADHQRRQGTAAARQRTARLCRSRADFRRRHGAAHPCPRLARDQRDDGPADPSRRRRRQIRPRPRAQPRSDRRSAGTRHLSRRPAHHRRFAAAMDPPAGDRPVTDGGRGARPGAFRRHLAGHRSTGRGRRDQAGRHARRQVRDAGAGHHRAPTEAGPWPHLWPVAGTATGRYPTHRRHQGDRHAGAGTPARAATICHRQLDAPGHALARLDHAATSPPGRRRR